MSMRPEGNDRGGYGDASDSYDENAWQEFTPYRPGDGPVTDEGTPMWSTGTAADGRRYGGSRPAEPIERSDGRGPQRPDQAEQPQRTGRWWTEDVQRRYTGGERVEATQAIGGPFMTHVRPGQVGHVVERRETLLNGDRLVVDFGNGYIERDVKPEQIQRKGWL